MRIGGYARLSFDDENTGYGVQRQAEDIQALARRKDWDLVEIYTDSNVSAYKKGIVRPEFERMVADLESGRIQGITAYDLDRVARQPRDLERLIDIYDSRPGLVFATVSGEIDLSKSDGRLMARVMISFANKSSADTARRVARAQLQRAQQGKVAGGGHRPYGYERDNVTVVPAEAAVIREAADRILAGDSLISVCKSFDGLYPTPGKSVKWNRTVLRKILLNPRIAGLRSYKGSVLMGDDGSPVKAIWEPIVSVETWEQLTTVLTDASRNLNGGRVDRKYLLSGLLRCPCGAKMTGAMSKGVPEYRCPTDRGCGRTQRKARALDEYVEKELLDYLERQSLDGLQVQEDELTSRLQVQIAEAEQSLSALIDEWTAGRISDAVFFAAQARKEAVLNALKGERAHEKRRQTMKAPVGAGVGEKWAGLTLPQKRAILFEVLQAIKVYPKPATAPKRFDKDYYALIRRTD